MPRAPGPLVLRKTYDNQQFADVLQLLLNRMADLVEREGPIGENYPIPHHAWRNAKYWLNRYENGTHSRQYLLDVANFCLVEYLCPSFIEPGD